MLVCEKKSLSGRRVLITGSSGFIGRRLCQIMHLMGAQVFGLTRSDSKKVSEYITKYTVELSNIDLLSKVILDARPDYVIHLAADKNRGTKVSDFQEAYQTNLLGTLNLIECCIALKSFERFIFLGSFEEYGPCAFAADESLKEQPVTAYGSSKLAATQLLKSFGKSINFPFVVLRPSIVYGPRQSVDMFLPALIKSLLSEQIFNMTDGNQIRDYVYIEDVVQAICKALSSPAALSQVINVCSSVPISIKSLVNKVAEYIGPDSISLVKFGGIARRFGEAKNCYGSNSRAAELLNWAPENSIDVGLAKTISFYREDLARI